MGEFIEVVFKLAEWIIVISAIRYAAIKSHFWALDAMSAGLAVLWCYFVIDKALDLLIYVPRRAGRKSRVAILILSTLLTIPIYHELSIFVVDIVGLIDASSKP